MAVESVTELWPGRAGEDNYTRHRTYSRVYEVYTTDSADDVGVVGGNILLPRLGDSHPNDIYAVVVAIRPTQDEADPLRWLVEISYDTQPEGPGGENAGEAIQPIEAPGGSAPPQPPGQRPENPLNRPAKWRWSFQQVSEPAVAAHHVASGGGFLPAVVGVIIPGGRKPILNTAGLPFDPPVMVERSRPVVTVTRNVAQFWNRHAEEVHDAVNSLTWKGFAPRTLRCLSVEASSGFENGVAFWELTYQFAINRDTWDHHILNCGFSEKRQRSNPQTFEVETYYERIKDSFGNEVTEPVPLDLDGRRLAPGLDPIYLRRCVYEPIDFATVVQL